MRGSVTEGFAAGVTAATTLKQQFVNETGGRFNSATFCGGCRPTARDNESMVVKASYFLSRPGLGAHTMVAGYDGFADKVASDNHQSGSGYRIIGTSSIVRNGVVYPQWNNVGSSTLIRYNPISRSISGTRVGSMRFTRSPSRLWET